MSKDTRFKPGRSGNPAGRPRKHHARQSAFDVVFDKRLTVTQNGKERDLSVEEALQQQTLQDALAGKRMAIRKVLKMIEKREAALAKKQSKVSPVKDVVIEHGSDNANEALQILGIADPHATGASRWNIQTWATQAALSRPGRKALDRNEVQAIEFFTVDAHTLNWPKGARGDD